MTPLMAWSGGMSPGRAGELLWSFCPSLYNDRCPGFFRSTGPSSCVSLRWLLEEFLHFACTVSSLLEVWYIFPPGFVSGTYMSCVWVLHEEY